MAQRVISTRISLDGEAEFKRQLSAVNGELRNLKGEMSLTTEEFKGNANSLEALTAKSKILRREVDQQEEKVKALERAVKDSSEAYGESDSRTDKYRQSLLAAKRDLVKMQRELDDTDKYMDEARKSTDKAAKSIDGFGREAQTAGDSLGGLQSFDLGGLLDGLKSLKGVAIGGTIVAGVKEVGDAILELEESTREYRKIMGTLEVSSEAAGYSADQTKEAYERLYGVLGDTQTTATTVANLQAIGIEHEELMELIDAATGAWATYGDSIPIDSLGEAINETIKTGEVVGTFADVLNWGAAEGENFGVKMRESTDANEDWNKSVEDAKSAEDFFNIALSECKTDAERADLVLQAMSKQGLAQAGKAWRDVNDDIVATHDAQSRWEEATGKLGEAVAPAAAAIKTFGADSIEWLAGKLDKLISKTQEAWEWLTTPPDNPKSPLRPGWEDRTKDWGLHGPRKPGRDQYLAGQRYFDGSHKLGLDRVPFDGYLAQLHAGETVLTADEAQVWRMLQAAPAPARQGVSTADLRAVTAAAVNAVSRAAAPAAGDLRVEVTVSGAKLAGAILPDFRRVSAARPEVVDD